MFEMENQRKQLKDWATKQLLLGPENIRIS